MTATREVIRDPSFEMFFWVEPLLCLIRLRQEDQ